MIGFFVLLMGAFDQEVFAQSSDGVTSSGSNSSWIAIEPYGRSPYPLVSRGLRLGYQSGDGTEYELTYSDAVETVLLTDFRVSEYEIRLNNPVGSVAYWGYGLGFRKLELDYDVFATDETDARHISDQAGAITANAHFGIRVRLVSWFAVGSDLFSLSQPIHWTKQEDSYPGDADNFEENPHNFPYVKDSFKLSFQFARTYVRVVF